MNENQNKKTEIQLTDKQIETIKKRVMEKVYADLGRSVAKWAVFILGSVALSLMAYWKGKGVL